MTFCNLNFGILSKDQLFQSDEKLKHIVTANADIIRLANQSEEYFNILDKAHLTFDGQVPVLLARLFSKERIEKLSGSDIVYDFASFAQANNKSIFFLGGEQSSNESAQVQIRNMYNVQINGFSPAYEDYPFAVETNKRILSEISNCKPDILFVGFGAPKQELWLRDNYSELQKMSVKYAIGSGGTFDFIAGKFKRAPVMIQSLGLEGVYRFLVQPSKMRFIRLLNSFVFVKYIFGQQRFLKK
jgi:N-acetylglucosaminyldiphosphoundecaprenol N-acetyl-beta-D-mannosaminyltransferase